MLRFPESGGRRVMEAVACGVLAAAVVAWFVPWQLTVLVGWDVTAVVGVTRVWTHVRGFDAETTRALATIEDPNRRTTELVLVTASLVSLFGVGAAFVAAGSAGSTEEVVLQAAGVFTIACSWATVHTVYAIRYAHEYYTEPEGGIDFKSRLNNEDPDYRDFAYVAFTVGMTFQVSDTDITRHVVRRTVLGHALLSFLFGSVILATTVNVVAGLLNN